MVVWWPQGLKTMISNCWSPSPANRPTFRAILDAWERLTLDLLCPDTLARKVAEPLWKDVCLYNFYDFPKIDYDYYSFLTIHQQKAKPDYTTFRKTFVHHCISSGKLKEKYAILLESLLRDSAFDDTVSFAR